MPPKSPLPQAPAPQGPPPIPCQERPRGHVSFLSKNFGDAAFTAWSNLGGLPGPMWADVPANVQADLATRAWPLGGGGAGPTGTMRLAKIAKMGDIWVDMEIFSLDQYRTDASNSNRLKRKGEDGSALGVINLYQPKSRSESANVATFRFQLFEHSDACGGAGPYVPDFMTWDASSCDTPLTIPHFTITFFDIDSEKEKVDGQGSYRPLEVRLPALCSSRCTYPPSPSLP